MTVDVIVCAHNEGERLGAVLDAIHGAPSVNDLIVVVDSSSDGTYNTAHYQADIVLSIEAADKGAAMAAGLAQAVTDDVAFCDGDLEGLTWRHIELLLTGGPQGGQVVGIPESDVAPGWWPSLSGERRLPRATALRAGLQGAAWRAETRLNAQVAREGLAWAHYRLEGVRNPPSWHPLSWLQVAATEAAYLPELLRYVTHPAGGSLPGVPAV